VTRIADSVIKISGAEEAKIQRQVASNPDAPEATDVQLAKAKPFAEAVPHLAETIRKNLGGRPRSDNPNVAVSIRLDPESSMLSRSKAKAGKAGQMSGRR
jgi:hypothetical protein